MSLFEEYESSAVIDEVYRYSLTRTWDAGKPRACFVMLNPSTADASENDPTIRRCIGFAKSWGYGSLEVVNLFAFRATDPSDLRKATLNTVGIENDFYIGEAIQRAAVVICAWGCFKPASERARAVLQMIPKPHYLKLGKDGDPCHPLYLPADLMPMPYEVPRPHPLQRLLERAGG
jgi:hypothetical protein